MNNIFAERLKKAMEQKNMKQIDLVKKAAEQGVKLGKSHVSQYLDRKSTRLNSSHTDSSRMPSSA